MPGLILDAPVEGGLDSARNAAQQGEQSLLIVEFDSKGNIIYKIPKRYDVTVEGTLVVRHYSQNTTTGVFSLLEERGPFTLFWFFAGITHLMNQHFRLKQDSIQTGSYVFGTDGGTYAKTDTHSVHPGWSYINTVNVGAGGVALLAGGDLTVLSSSFPSEILAFGRGAITAFAGETIGAADIGLRSRENNVPTDIFHLHCIAEDVGTFTAVSCIGPDGPRSTVDYIMEFSLKETTAADSVIS